MNKFTHERNIKMKKILIPLLLILVLVLTACGSKDTTTDQSTTTGTGSLTTETELIIGTFKLDGTDNEVTAGEAADLIPLWQAYLTLSQSDTTAQAELDALIGQIQEAIGSEKMDAITAMKITQEDVMTVMQAQGIMMGGRNAANASGTPVAGQYMGGFNTDTMPDPGNMPSGGAGPQGAPPSGAMPQGGQGFVMRGNVGGQEFSGEMDPSIQATMEASGIQAPSRSMRVPVALIEALIEYLKAR
jgi:hypothetical protein